VTDRYIPFVTAAYGTRVARPVRTTSLAPGDGGLKLDERVRPVLGDHCLVGKPQGGAACRELGGFNSRQVTVPPSTPRSLYTTQPCLSASILPALGQPVGWG
jgi:hypothetical protein